MKGGTQGSPVWMIYLILVCRTICGKCCHPPLPEKADIIKIIYR